MRDRSILEPTFEQYKIPRDFKKYPIKKNGVYSNATNDADYITQIYETLRDGKQKPVWRCPTYSAWCDMMKRSYSQKHKEKRPTYQNVTVCDEWHLFSNFRNWWIKNSVRNWQLDKDILHRGNLMYSPESCIYVPNHINMILVDSAAARGEFPLGVCFHKQNNKFQSRVMLNGKQKYLGLFTSPQEAHKVWQVAKIDCIKDAIAHYTGDANHLGVFDQRIVSALEGRISSLQDDISNNRETLALH